MGVVRIVLFPSQHKTSVPVGMLAWDVHNGKSRESTLTSPFFGSSSVPHCLSFHLHLKAPHTLAFTCLSKCDSNYSSWYIVFVRAEEKLPALESGGEVVPSGADSAGGRGGRTKRPL